MAKKIEEGDQTKKEISTYLINQEITDKNDMTGIFKDKNLIFIMGDSVNYIIAEYPKDRTSVRYQASLN